MNTVNYSSNADASRTGDARVATVQFVALSIFTLIVVTSRWSLAELAIAVALIGMVVGRQRMRFPAPFWWGAALIGWAFFTSFFALSPEIARDTLIQRFKVILVFLVVLNAIRTERQLRIYLLIIVGSFMIYPARGALLNYVHGETLYGRAIWNMIYRNPNDLGALALLAAGAALSIASVETGARALRWGAATCVGILIVVMLLTQSRGVFLGLTIGLGPPLLTRAMRRPKVAIYALVLVSIAVSILPDALWVRLGNMTKLTSTATIAQADPEGSAAQRWEIQKIAWKVFADHPILGSGLGCYELANARAAPRLGARDTHDTYLNLAAELGAPGLLLWIALVLSVLLYVRRRRQNRRPDVRAIPTVWMERVIVGYLIAGIFGTYSALTMFYLILGTLWCAATLSVQERSEVLVRRVY